jgi:D-3-phosphoglycerate dehydrogenase
VKKADVSTHLLVVRHLDRVGVLADIFGVLKGEGASVQEMENIVLGGAKSAIAQMALDKEPSGPALDQIRQHSCVFDASCMAIA